MGEEVVDEGLFVVAPRAVGLHLVPGDTGSADAGDEGQIGRAELEVACGVVAERHLDLL